MFEDVLWSPVRAIRTALGGSCEVCRGWHAGRLCGACRDRFAAPHHRCDRCGLRLGEGAQRCGACLTEPPAFEHCLCAVDYGFPWDRLMARFKFNAAPELAPLLTDLLLQAARYRQMPWPEVFLPVPLSDERLEQRGYDQAWELARRLGQAAGVATLPRGLVRRFDSRQQVRLTRRERQANLRGAFVVAPGARARLEGRRVGLVDDVMTTGATAHEAAVALKDAGAHEVDLWVVARTPAPGQAE